MARKGQEERSDCSQRNSLNKSKSQESEATISVYERTPALIFKAAESQCSAHTEHQTHCLCIYERESDRENKSVSLTFYLWSQDFNTNINLQINVLYCLRILATRVITEGLLDRKHPVVGFNQNVWSNN